MKALILAGGLGTRISEESHLRPKPMIEIGEMPILWHIMKTYSHYGINDFVILAGYRQHMIKEWFANYFLHTSDVTFDFTGGKEDVVIHRKRAEPWKVTVVDTGLYTMTGGRIKRAREYVGDETFMLTYGDGVGNVNITKLLEFHKKSGNAGTITAYNFGQYKGVVEIGRNGHVEQFREKSDLDGDLINIGFMVFEPELFDYIEGDGTVLEKEPLNKLVELGKMGAYLHEGFWQCMDNMREKEELERLWNSGKAPWKEWQD